MKRLLLIILGLILAGIAALYALRDPGTADISLLGWQLHTSALGFLVLLIGLMIALSIVWKALAALLRLPAFFRARSARARKKQADDALLRAFAESTRGRFAEAESLAMTHQEAASVGPMHFVVAIDAALARGDTPTALTRLDQARAIYPRFASYLSLHMAKQLTADGQHAIAIELLQRLYSTHEQDEAVLLTLATALYAGEDWEKLHSLMPAVRRLKPKQLDEQTLWQWERGQLIGRLGAVVRSGRMDEWHRWSQEIPKKLKADAGLIRAQADAARALGNPQAAKQVLERALMDAPNAALLRQWLPLTDDEAPAATTLLDRVLTAHPGSLDDATIALARAHLALHRDDFAATQQWLAPLLTPGTDFSALMLAAELAERQRDSASASAWYAKALALRGTDA